MFPSCFVKASYMTPKEAAELFFTIGRPDKLNTGCFGSDLRVLIWYNYKWKSECYFGFNTSKYFCAGACMSASIKKTTRTKVCVFGGEVIVRCFNTWQTKLSIFERKRKWQNGLNIMSQSANQVGVFQSFETIRCQSGRDSETFLLKYDYWKLCVGHLACSFFSWNLIFSSVRLLQLRNLVFPSLLMNLIFSNLLLLNINLKLCNGFGSYIIYAKYPIYYMFFKTNLVKLLRRFWAAEVSLLFFVQHAPMKVACKLYILFYQ